MPFLLGDRLVARVDLKADRSARCLRVLAANVEFHGEANAVAAALAVELRSMASWLGLEYVGIEDRGNLARRLARANRDNA